MKRRDIISSLSLTLFALAMLRPAYKLSLGSAAQPGPGFLPFWSFVILAVLSLAIFVQSVLGGDLKAAPLWPDKTGARKVISVMIALFLYTVFLDYLGTLLCTSLLMFALLKFIDPQKSITAILFSLLTTVIIYILFESFMKSQLPRGFIEKLFGV
jgi:hypothetical protein